MAGGLFARSMPYSSQPYYYYLYFSFEASAGPVPPERAGAFGSGTWRRIVRGPGISAAGKDKVMGEGCGKFEGVQTKKGAGVWPAVISFWSHIRPELRTF